MMKTMIESAVAALFENYEKTPQLSDFQEEIIANLMERVRDLTKHGMSEEKAVGKALAELGDVTGIADAIGKQKRQEAIGDFYLSNKPLDRGHAMGYSIAGAVLLVGLILAFVIGARSGVLGKALLIFLPFGLISVCAFTYLGLTQDTRTHFPMSKKRSILYTVATGLTLGGALLGGAMVFFQTHFTELTMENILERKIQSISLLTAPTSAILLLLIVPGLAMLIYLILTQEKRFKPWVLEQNRKYAEQYADAFEGRNGERFGLMSGFIWILAIAVFVLLGFTIGWHPAWVVFLFAMAAEMLLLVVTSGRKKG